MIKIFFFLFSETKKTKTSIDAIDKMPKGQEANVLDAASQGAANAVFLVANIGGTLIAGGSKTSFPLFDFYNFQQNLREFFDRFSVAFLFPCYSYFVATATE